LPALLAATSLLSTMSLLHAAAATAGDDRVPHDGPAATAAPSPNATAVTIRDVQLEHADPIDDMPTSTLTFDVHNTVESSVTDVVVGVAVLRTPKADSQEAPGVVVRPFTIRLREVVLGGSSIRYELRLRNLSSDCACTPKVGVIDARILSEPAATSQSPE
jgi:hypothetical protein